MKILYVITRSDEIGGAHIHLRDMALWMQNENHDVTIAIGGNGFFYESLCELGLKTRSLKHLIRSISPVSDLKAVIELRKIIKAEKPDIVALHSAKAGLIGRIASIGLNIPVIFTAHGWSFVDGVKESNKKIFRLIEKFSAVLCKKIVTVCNADKELAEQASITKRSKIITIHNGIPDITPNKLAHPKNSPCRLFMAARFEIQKDHETLIRALATITNQDWVLDLAGDGVLQESCKKLATDLNISEKINFLGRRSDIESLLASSDIALLISNWEGFPISILEAMRAQLPVVATNTAGVKEAITHDYNGFLVSPKDVDSLSNLLSKLIGDPVLRCHLGKNGRERYLEHFKFDKMALKYQQLYFELIGKA